VLGNQTKRLQTVDDCISFIPLDDRRLHSLNVRDCFSRSLRTGVAIRRCASVLWLDEGRFHCSIRTMYRLLETHGESRERRDQLTHPPYQKPELLATAPNQLWSWDITKLRGAVKSMKDGLSMIEIDVKAAAFCLETTAPLSRPSLIHLDV
jgi:hypothetical protein